MYGREQNSEEQKSDSSDQYFNWENNVITLENLAHLIWFPRELQMVHWKSTENRNSPLKKYDIDGIRKFSADNFAKDKKNDFSTKLKRAIYYSVYTHNDQNVDQAQKILSDPIRIPADPSKGQVAKQQKLQKIDKEYIKFLSKYLLSVK